MSDVKWIKIVTDIFDDEKILLIESMPDKYAIIVCWFKLLCLAGKQNNHGALVMNNRIAYTDEMLATVFRMPVKNVKTALETFRSFGMIDMNDGVITVSNWDKHQSLDAYERKKERDRKLQTERRERQKIACMSDDCQTIVRRLSDDLSDDSSSDVAVSDKEEEEDSINTLVNKSVIGEKPTRFVPPSVDEVRAYCTERGNGVDAERFVDYYTARGWLAGKSKMKDWKAAVRTWERNDREDRHGSTDTGEAAADVPERGQYGTWL